MTPFLKCRCPFCPTCQMPEAECGYCKFCDSINCPESNKQCVGDICNPFLGNIKADTLLEIDVNREYPQAQPHISPQVSTAAQCCKACMDRAGCNAWTYCAGVEGCGIGCSDELLRPYGSCIEDRYPPFLCSLKVVRDPSAPELWLEDGSQWVSGVVLGEPSSPASEEQEQLLVDPFVEALSE